MVDPIFFPRERQKYEMIRQLLKKLQMICRPASVSDGKAKGPDPVEILRADYHDLQRLAAQIGAHAERAPYPHVAQRLRQIAYEKQKSSTLLKEKILSLGYESEGAQPVIKSGKNHWDRMVQDLEDQKTLENFFLQQAVRLADEVPEISDLLRRVVAAQLPHKEILLDLVARADPQAEQS